MNKDPIASLAPFAVTVDLYEREFTIPALPALDWLKVLLEESPNLWNIVPGMLPEQDRVLVEDAVALGQISYQELLDVSHDVIAVTTGRDYWFVLRLCAIVRASWDTVGGSIARLQLDARVLSLSAWIDAVFHVCCEMIGSSGKDAKQKLVSFVSELEAPPPGESVEFDEEAEALAFERMVRMSG